MKIILKQITLLNFKGVRNLTIDFDEQGTSICGRNRLGKTTVFDAFTWLLFGKDSRDRKEFNIKTLDENNKAIERIPHEVSAILLIDGVGLQLRKCYSEKWSKTRGKAEEEFKGHEVTQFVNDVPCKASEYSAQIADICPEETFKLITNPLYFPNQKKEVQRKVLEEMAGTISDEEIVSTNPDFLKLIDQLSGKTLEGYKKEIASKKRRIKDDLEGIPSRIDERQRSMPESEDWEALNKDLNKKKETRKNIDDQIIDRSKSFEQAGKEREEISQKLNLTNSNRNSYEHTLKENLLRDYRKKVSERNLLLSKINTLETKEKVTVENINTHNDLLTSYNNERQTLLSEYRRINAETMEFKEGDFDCPTCKRPLDIEDIEHKQTELSSNFNNRKSTQLELNKKKGLSIKEKIVSTEENLLRLNTDLDTIRKELNFLRESDLFKNAPIEPDIQQQIGEDENYKGYNEKIKELTSLLEADIEIPDTLDLQNQKNDIDTEIEDLNKKLSKKIIIDNNNKRIKELESQHKKLSQELADLEGIEFTINEFTRAKIDMIEQRTNGLFSLVKFKMFEQQINGGEIETCEAMINGVPFSDLNSASQINAGLDILNAICKYHGRYAPIFVDNAESVNELHPTQSQLIKLVVTNDEQLIIE